MKILLFGNKGQVGREIEELALSNKVAVFGFDIDTLDITSQAAVKEVFAKHANADIVINAAAYTAVDKAEDEPEQAYAVNCNAVENLAESCREYDIPLLQFTLRRYGLETRFPWPPFHHDLMKIATDILNLQGKTGNKYPTLMELYVALFDEEFLGAHDAEQDAMATMSCAMKLKEQGYLRL